MKKESIAAQGNRSSSNQSPLNDIRITSPQELLVQFQNTDNLAQIEEDDGQNFSQT